MKKFIALLLCIGICFTLYLGLDKGTVTALAKENSPSINITDKEAESFFWALLPDKKEWPKPILVFWKVTHMKDNTMEKVGKDNWVKLKDIAPTLRTALISIEDRRFYEHSGVDIDSILRAILVNIQADGVVQGGSTLTQQLVKNTVLDSEQTIERKIYEALLALIVESENSKDDILEMYLNTTYFGAGATGIKEAADTYFGVLPFQLSLPESATIAGLPYAPSSLNPYENKEGCKKRRDLVLAQMAKNGVITMDEAKAAAEEPLTLSGKVGHSI